MPIYGAQLLLQHWPAPGVHLAYLPKQECCCDWACCIADPAFWPDELGDPFPMLWGIPRAMVLRASTAMTEKYFMLAVWMDFDLNQWRTWNEGKRLYSFVNEWTGSGITNECVKDEDRVFSTQGILQYVIYVKWPSWTSDLRDRRQPSRKCLAADRASRTVLKFSHFIPADPQIPLKLESQTKYLAYQSR